MSEGIAIALLTVLCSLIGGLSLIVVQRVFRQGDANSKKLDEFGAIQQSQGIALTRVETALLGIDGQGGLLQRYHADHERRNAEYARELEAAIEEARQLRKQLEGQQ